MPRPMNAKQYEATLDEEFTIGNITVSVAFYPDGWAVHDNTNDRILFVRQLTKKAAIKLLEEYTGCSYDPEKVTFIV